MKLSNFIVDSETIEQGDWVTIVEAEPDAKPTPKKAFRVKVRGYGNSDYRRLQSELTRALQTEFAFAADKIPWERWEDVESVLLYDTLLTGWDGLTEDDEVTEILYSKEKAKDFITNPDYRPLRTVIEGAVRSITIRKKKASEQATKN